MMSKQTLDDLRGHLFAAIEGIQNLSDPGASAADKTTVEQAHAISKLASGVIAIAKLKVEAIKIVSNSDNPSQAQALLVKQDLFLTA